MATITMRICDCGCGEQLPPRKPGTRGRGASYIPGHSPWANRRSRFNETPKECATCGKEVKRPEGKGRRPKYCSDLCRPFYKNYKLLDTADYDTLYERQDGKCMICKKGENNVSKLGKLRKLSRDHCHTSKVLRDLLCANCNTALGLLCEDIEIMESMIEYVKRWKAITGD